MKYYIKDHGETSKDAIEVPRCEETDPDYFVDEAAQYEHDYRDGWESAWPLIFTVITDDGVEIDYEVDRSYDPIFESRRLNDDEKSRL